MVEHIPQVAVVVALVELVHLPEAMVVSAVLVYYIVLLELLHTMPVAVAALV
jgi:hypothetical protein